MLLKIQFNSFYQVQNKKSRMKLKSAMEMMMKV